MFISKCMSVLLSFAISINTGYLWDSSYGINTYSTEVEQDSIVEEIPEAKPEEIVELIEVEPEPESISEPELPLTEDEIDLVALVTMAEAEGEPEDGKRLVIDVILNRLDSPRFPDTVKDVVYAKNQFEVMVNGRIERCYVRDDIRQLVIEELQSRTNHNIHYFRANHYHGFGIPVVQVGNHYFSTY